jgi:uncharacterized membrane protein (UPF0127 family)
LAGLTRIRDSAGAFRTGGSRLVLVALALCVLSCGERTTESVSVHVGTGTIRAELALTPSERALGLSGRDALDRDAGMLFVFKQPGFESFWMKDMRFPLDFVWISSDRRVLELTRNVPPPAAGTSDAGLAVYKPSAAVGYVLEINGGVADQLGITTGQAVTFSPEVDADRAR